MTMVLGIGIMKHIRNLLGFFFFFFFLFYIYQVSSFNFFIAILVTEIFKYFM